MLQNALSLQIDHGCQHVLVNSAGAQTQLQHMGRHLYWKACPSQHSLSPCVIGNLSQVIGFLPADKELHEQRLAYTSSSSTDLDEDIGTHQAEQDRLNFPCQHVLPEAFHEHDDLSFQHVPSTEEVAAQGGEPKVSFYSKSRQPQLLVTQERELHTINHVSSSSWCVECHEAKDRAFQLRNSQTSTKTSTIQLQYAYMRQPQDKEPTMILTWVESLAGFAGSKMTSKKGPTANQLDAVVTFIKEQGFEQSILQCDGEPALVELLEELGKQTSLPTSKSPACSQQLQEWQKNLFAQFRALLSDFCHRYKLQPSEVEIGSSLSQHMLRHAEWLLNRFQLQSDNKTSFHRRWGATYNSVLTIW